MNKLRDKLDPKYLKICTYAGATVIATVVILWILSYSGGFWQTLWVMFTAILKPIVIGGIICYLFLPIVERIEKLLSKEEKPWRRPAAVAIFYVSVALILLLCLLILFFAVKGSVTNIVQEIREVDIETLKKFVLSLKDTFAAQFAALEMLFSQLNLPFGKIGGLVNKMIGSVTGFFSGLMFGVIFSVYFMLDGENILTY